MMPNTRKEILMAAKELIRDPHDWGQGLRYGRANKKSSCALEAINRSSISSLDREQTVELLLKIINYPIQSITTWNDDPDRTHEEVLQAFDKAIASS